MFHIKNKATGVLTNIRILTINGLNSAPTGKMALKQSYKLGEWKPLVLKQ